MKSKLSEAARKLMQTKAGQRLLDLPADRREKLIELAATKIVLDAKQSKLKNS